MYITDKQRKEQGKDSWYTAPQLDKACEEYFKDCDSQEPPKQPTLPGLLIYLGVTMKDWKVWEEGQPGYRQHPQICEKALLEIRDRLEQRKDAGAIFLLKQKPYGGYSDRPEAENSGQLKVEVTFGKPNKNIKVGAKKK